MRLVITGATGFIGRHLVKELLAAGHSVVALTRNPSAATRLLGDRVQAVSWGAQSGWQRYLDGADGVINLAGEPIAGARWTPTVKQRILASRVDATRALVEGMRAAKQRPAVFISGSAVGYYGIGAGPVDESAPAGADFLADLCAQWEAAARTAESLGVRVVYLRIGVVLGESGGALARMLLPFKLFAGGPIGTGEQPFPWIHLRDVTLLIRFALQNPAVTGPINAVAPESCTNRAFGRALGRAMRRPSWLPVPPFALRLALGEMADAMLLTGQHVRPAAAQRLGYAFQFPHLAGALADLMKR